MTAAKVAHVFAIWHVGQINVGSELSRLSFYAYRHTLNDLVYTRGGSLIYVLF